nr:hypothetical protein [Lysobacter sp. GX 14042]
MAGGAAALWAAREFVGAVLSRKKNRTETDANVELLNSLREGLDRQGQRIRAMEEAHLQIAQRLEDEIKARQAAQEEAFRLRLRVQVLESAMRQVGMVIPPETNT